jgi:cytochrome d ubiquinol oxidase subunit II
MSALAVAWFWIDALLLAAYAVLDGFDLGAGMAHGFTRDPARKDRFIGAISPVWNGNEVWLLAGVGSLLAAFPPVYSGLLSGLYIPVILVLMALVLRGCGVEFRDKVGSPALARILDGCIFWGSLIPAWGIGLAGGSVLAGFPVDAQGAVQGSPFFFLKPFPLAAAFLSLSAFLLQGILYASLKSERDERAGLVKPAGSALLLVAVFLAGATILGAFSLGPRFGASRAMPAFWACAIAALAGYLAVFAGLRAGRPGLAFAGSSLGLASLVGVSASLLFPVLIPSSLGADITVANAASADPTLKVMLILACVALPLIALYSVIAYRSFRGAAKK